jgi:hypothetical protein
LRNGEIQFDKRGKPKEKQCNAFINLGSFGTTHLMVVEEEV